MATYHRAGAESQRKARAWLGESAFEAWKRMLVSMDSIRVSAAASASEQV
jgi:hypothetical protein